MPNISPLHLPPFPPAGERERFTWGNLSGASLGLVLSQAIGQNQRPVVIVTPDMSTAMRLGHELLFFQEEASGLPPITFPDWETLPYDQFSPHQDIISGRLSALHQIPMLTQGAVITPISTLMHRLPPCDFLSGHVFLLTQGKKLNRDAARRQLEKAGYRCVTQVREHGEFAVRGAILDVFPMGSHDPYRIDLFDDTIDSIRTFSPDTQRSLEKINKIACLPAKEFPLDETAIELFRQQWRSQFNGNPLDCPIYQDISEKVCPPGIEYYLPLFFAQTASLFDYLPSESLIIAVGEIHTKAEEFWQEIQSRYGQHAYDTTRPLLKPEQVFIPAAEIFSHFKNYSYVKTQLERVPEKHNHLNFAAEVPLKLKVDHKAARPLQTLEQFLTAYQGRILFCAETAGRREVLLELLNQISLHPHAFNSWQAFLASTETCGITVAPLDDGLSLQDPELVIIAESQLFGDRIMQRRRRKETPQNIDAIVKDLTELQVGAPVVHIDHGVGRYLGLQILTVNGQDGEFLSLEYASGDKLYIPVASLHLISRYSGAEPENAPLHKLGTDQWQRAKRKAAEQVCDVAAELLDIYAKRAARTGIVYPEIDGQYATFAAAFPFEETPDQQQAINAIIRDMQSEKPMDRLICGDVGFGKTEVAMRAAFIAAYNAKQTAVLVPTTLLAQQHYQTFKDRFADWPVQIAVMSRFHQGKEQHKMLEDLAQGKIDIVIGTHKLLQADIQFKSLGLVIIDEEHRFGVQQKERLKSLRINVDILTLTATPIPRTLNMAFADIRDLSLIATPPARRLSIKTFIHAHHNALIQEALSREILRGGQAYFLHNDIATIERTAHEISRLVPEARSAIAHGQMHERELEQVMRDFYHRRFNVLVCTTIIESGIDVPSANTIIINHADKLGLAQLHQLRGRVGRSHHQAYAYLLVPSIKGLTPDAAKRLDAIAASEELGIGFTLATHDLEIRGAGELLGKNQSGQMHAIGFSLYMDLLGRAVAALKAGKELEMDNLNPSATEIELQLPAFIPEHYLGDVHLRLQCYKRIASTKTQNELDDINVEMIDRFGLLPPQVKNLFAISALKQAAERLGIRKIEANSKGGKLEFIDHPPIDSRRIIQLIQLKPQAFRLDGGKCLKFTLPEHPVEDRIELVKKILKEFE